MAERGRSGRKGTRRQDAGRSEVADFLDIAGHELRSPLTALKGHAQLLQRRLAKQPERTSEITEMDKMLYQIGRLEQELDVYLEAARIFGKRFRLQPEPADLVVVAKRLVDLQRKGAADDVLSMEYADVSLPGLWDRRRLQLALGVLLSNASKYGLGRETTLRLAGDGARVRVEVEDNGLGVPAAERRGIFGAYVTGGNVENAGLGLGLYVAREIVRRSGGTVGMRARPGGGSLFWFELPTGRDAVDTDVREDGSGVVRAMAEAPARGLA